MTKSTIIYEEKTNLVAQYYHPQSGDYLDYNATIQIKSSGKNPVQIFLKFDGIYPYAAPMPPEEHKIVAPSIIELYVKLARWFAKFGYEIK